MLNLLPKSKEKYTMDITNNEYEIRFGAYSFPYFLCNDASTEFLEPLFQMVDVDIFIIVCDQTIGALYAPQIAAAIRKNNYQCFVLTIKSGESNKNLKTLEELLEKALELKVTRSSCIIGLGGGLCGNIAGLMSVLLFRGIRLVHIPTSLMAILDSVISLKQAINSVHGKNLIGAYQVPVMVIANINFLKTLPRAEIVSGLCEIVKNALAIVPETIDYLMQLGELGSLTELNYNYLIDLGIKAKLTVMQNDPFEKNEGLVLEYGHTIGHAIELALNGQINHGQAVGLGMISAAQIASLLGFLTEAEVDLHETLLKKIGAPLRITGHLAIEDIMSVLRFDNKRGYLKHDQGKIHLILLEKIGKPLAVNGSILTAVPENVVCEGLQRVFRE
ncbi:MAG TPA: iron-containing alcohol dehydrogenase [Bacillota bacterium]